MAVRMRLHFEKLFVATSGDAGFSWYVTNPNGDLLAQGSVGEQVAGTFVITNHYVDYVASKLYCDGHGDTQIYAYNWQTWKNYDYVKVFVSSDGYKLKKPIAIPFKYVRIVNEIIDIYPVMKDWEEIGEE